jgi:hypothetical protein
MRNDPENEMVLGDYYDETPQIYEEAEYNPYQDEDWGKREAVAIMSEYPILGGAA